MALRKAARIVAGLILLFLLYLLVRQLPVQSWIIAGLLRADEVAEATGFVMPEGDYETVAGLVLERLGRIPDVGDEVELDGWRLIVTRMDRRRRGYERPGSSRKSK